MRPRIIYWPACAVTQYLWIFFTHFSFNMDLATHCSATVARAYQISGTPSKIDWDKNRKEDSVLKIQSKSRATSAEPHLRLICWYEVWTSRYTLGLWGNKHQYCIEDNITWFISQCLKFLGSFLLGLLYRTNYRGDLADFWRVNLNHSFLNNNILFLSFHSMLQADYYLWHMFSDCSGRVHNALQLSYSCHLNV